MQFLYQPLTWGFLLVAVPIIVHLINMLRHRRVKWAAMDFLLESHRRNRRWIMLKQWLLLASRLLAMFLLVMMLARWISGSQWLSWIGGQTTHHYLLLDDSYSMAEESDGESAYGRALGAMSSLVERISKRPGQHQVTLLRWSRAELALREAQSEARLDTAADLNGQSISQEPAKLLERINATSPTSLSLTPEKALELVVPMVADNAEQASEVYLLSDLRRNEFAQPEELKSQLQTLRQNDAEIHLIDCGGTEEGNLSIVSVEPEQDVWAAGVPLMVRFQVRNRTLQPVKNVVVRVRLVTYANGLVKPEIDKPYSGEIRDEPAVVIEEIQPGETVTRQFQALFGLPGNHVVEVSIDDDTLAFDNKRWCSIEIQESQRVLLVDGDVEQDNAFYFESVVKPNPRLSTGIRVDKQDAAYLRDVLPEVLRKFDVIVLLDVPRLDPQALDKLREFVLEGGGLFQVLGPNTNQRFVNEQLYDEDATRSLFPAEIVTLADIPQDPTATEPQVSAMAHPILGPLLQLQNSPFFQLRIRKLAELKIPDSPLFEIVATGPGGVPLLVDAPLGEGRVLTMLSGLDTEWSNWPQDPTFVVLALRSFGYLGSFRREPTSSETGAEVSMVVSDEPVLPDGEIIMPGLEGGIRVRLQQKVEQATGSVLAQIRLKPALDGPERDLVDTLLRPGVFESWMTTSQGELLAQNAAHNVAAAEGDLERVSRAELEQSLRGVQFEFRSANSLASSGLKLLDSEHGTLLLGLLGLLLVGEQLLAYSASYHAPLGDSKR